VVVQRLALTGVIVLRSALRACATVMRRLLHTCAAQDRDRITKFWRKNYVMPEWFYGTDCGVLTPRAAVANI
jgi:hypothetical protein